MPGATRHDLASGVYRRRVGTIRTVFFFSLRITARQQLLRTPSSLSDPPASPSSLPSSMASLSAVSLSLHAGVLAAASSSAAPDNDDDCVSLAVGHRYRLQLLPLLPVVLVPRLLVVVKVRCGAALHAANAISVATVAACCYLSFAASLLLASLSTRVSSLAASLSPGSSLVTW